jgi:hypothetical protein
LPPTGIRGLTNRKYGICGWDSVYVAVAYLLDIKLLI